MKEFKLFLTLFCFIIFMIIFDFLIFLIDIKIL